MWQQTQSTKGSKPAVRASETFKLIIFNFIYTIYIYVYIGVV